MHDAVARLIRGAKHIGASSDGGEEVWKQLMALVTPMMTTRVTMNPTTKILLCIARDVIVVRCSFRSMRQRR